MSAASKDIMVYAEFSAGSLHPVSFELLGKARELAAKASCKVLAIIVGSGVSEAARELVFHGADVVYAVEHASMDGFDARLFQQNIVSVVREVKPGVLLLGATPIGRSLGPRVAAALGTGITADCTELDMTPEGKLVQVRPAFAGNILASIQTSTRPQTATVRYRVMKPSARDTTRKGEIILKQAAATELSGKILSRARSKRMDISNAEVIVSVGRGILKPEDIGMIRKLAEALGAVVGSSRPLVDDGWTTKEQQVGFSGNTVKPKLYIACGISGSPQHLAGMRDSEHIVAINKDASAPIFGVSDVGVQMDIYEIVPLLTEELQKRKPENTRH
jgi:electron transfer flavoprotein alpha subunit